MKLIGFNQGQYGDLCINLIAARSVKELYPESNLTFSINKKYKAISNLFKNNKLIDNIHIWDGYDNWPTNDDLDFLNQNKFDKIYHPMAKHLDDFWFTKRHQTEEVCVMHGLPTPKNLKIDLTQNFEFEKHNHIAVCFSGITRGDRKSFNFDNAKSICQKLEHQLNLDVYQIGDVTEVQYAPNKFEGSFFECAKFILGSKILITVDTCWSWIASGYNKPTLGLYSYKYYPNCATSKNWQPINSNGIYIESDDVNNIDKNLICNEALKILKK